jgi:sialate O-acetylesterase
MKLRNYLIVKIGEIILVITVLLLCLAFKVNAQLQPSKIFSNGMVLQRDISIPVWGTASAGANIIVKLNEDSVSGIADANGQWKVVLSAMTAGGPYQMTIESGTKTLNYKDVYIGDVWLASGQSNMELTVSQANDAATEIAAANNQMIRQFKVPKTITKEPTNELPAGCAWTPATAANVGNFTAAGYYFAKTLFADINVPIGIINTSYGGARIEAWMSEEMLGYDEDAVVLAGGTYQERQPTLCYNQMLKPLEGLPIKGFIWYQGESNADYMEDALEYGSLFKKMITSWRENWGLGDLPFIWVQLPNYGVAYEAPQAWDAWPILRANQSIALSLPNTAEAVTIDIGDVDIHPKNKIPVGERLALCARKVVYNEDIVFSGPRYKSHKLQPDGKVVIKYDHIGSGLVAKNSTTKEVSGFSIEGSDGTLSWANTIISGDSVIVWNNSISNPEIVRYAWEYNPATANLYNAENLPAAPFKINVTDPGFIIKSFSSSASTIERGQTAVLSWESYGASSVTLNDATVDSISGRRVQPMETTTYTLKITDRLHPEVTKSNSVTITVVDPKPTISISTSVGGVTSPGTEILLIATAKATKGKSIEQVDFYIDGILVGTDGMPPYEIKWTPVQAGNYSYTAKVTESLGVSTTSTPSIIYVTKLKMLIYEAENATFTSGKGSVITNSKVSNKKYLDMNSNGWVITFDNVEAPETAEFPLSIRYLLNYQSPKNQILKINGTSLGEITFTSPDATTWSTYFQNVKLNKGINTIEIVDSWGWMSFDYIAISVEDTTSSETGGTGMIKSNSLFLKYFPNPVRASAVINYNLPDEGKVKLEIYSTEGKKMKTLLNEMKPSGLNSVKFDRSGLQDGIYFAKIEFNSILETQKIVLIR